MGASFKNPGTVLVDPTLEQLRAAARRAHGEGWGPENDAAVDRLYEEIRREVRGNGASDRVAVEWKPWSPDLALADRGRLVNVVGPGV